MDLNNIFQLANKYYENNQFNLAIEIYKKILIYDKPKEVLYNIARSYIELNDFKNAIKYYNLLIKLYPNYTQAYFDRSIVYFYLNDFKKWAKDYEKRIDFSAFNSPLPIKYPKKKKKDFKKQILIFWEQGFGDSINFIKFIKYFNPKNTTILIQEPLIKLFQNSFKEYKFITKLDNKQYDFIIPLMSLPIILKKLNFIPSKAYLKVKKTDIKKFKNKYIKNSKLNIGLFWQGNPKSSRDKYRSIEFALLNNLLNLKKFGINFYSLQKDIRVKDDRVIDIAVNFKNFYDTSVAIKSLDLIITIDSSIAHLAGALGVKTYLLLPTLPDFRWRLNKNNLFYKSIKLFRQVKKLDWNEPLFKIQQKLLKKLNIKEKNIILFRSHSGSDNDPKLIRIGDFIAYFIWASYFKQIEKKYIIFSATSQLTYDFKAWVLAKNLFDEIYFNYQPPIKNCFDPDSIGGLWYATPLIYQKYKQQILPKLNFDKKEVNQIFTNKKDYIIFAPLVNAKYNTPRNMDKKFVNNFANILQKNFRDKFFVIVEDEELIKNKQIQTIKSIDLYDLFYFISKAKIFIGGDTGFSHFSALARVKIIITLYGTKYPGIHNNLPFNANIMVDPTTSIHKNYILKNNQISNNEINQIISFLKEIF